jgi:transposase
MTLITNAGYRCHYATAFASGVCDASCLRMVVSSRLGSVLVPRQYSSGGKNKLGSITKAGDVYLRTMLTQGARSIVFQSKEKNDPSPYGFSDSLPARHEQNRHRGRG